MSEIAKIITELGFPVGVAVVALWYVAFRTVPKHVYDSMCEREGKLADSVSQLTERIGILLDRTGART